MHRRPLLALLDGYLGRHPDELDEVERVRALVLVATTPRFVRGAGWPNALPAALLRQFSDDLARDRQAVVSRFLVLQAGRDERARRVVSRLRALLAEAGEPDARALSGGLALLRGVDLRARIGDLRCPVLLILGERDTLVPVGVAEDIRRLAEGWRIESVARSGHAPFLSHPRDFVRLLGEFLDDVA